MTRPALTTGDGGGRAPGAGSREPAAATVWTRWVTAGDERSCPACAALAGALWPERAGPQPPLHQHCRCRREYAFTITSSRAE